MSHQSLCWRVMDLATVLPIFLVTLIIFLIIFLFCMVIVFCRDETGSHGSDRRSWISWISSPEDDSSICLPDISASLLKQSSRTMRSSKKGSNASTNHYFGFGDEVTELESDSISCPTTITTPNSRDPLTMVQTKACVNDQQCLTNRYDQLVTLKESCFVNLIPQQSYLATKVLKLTTVSPSIE